MAHIAILCRNYPPMWGGAERVAEQLAHGLTHRGHQVTVLTAWNRGLPRRDRSSTGVEVRRLGLGGRPGRLNSLTCTVHLGWIILVSGQSWDVLHNFLISTFTVLGALWASFTGRPFFVSLGGTGPGSDFGQIFKLSWQGHRKLRFIARRAEFIACSAESRQQVQAAGVQDSRSHLLSNPVDLRRFRPSTPVERKELREKLCLTGPVVLFVGRLVRVKGLDRLMEAWPEVLRHYPNAMLVIVGDGPEFAVLNAQMLPSVRLQGAGDPAPFYQAADLFVLPSRSEGMSLALLEAMACGLPVVATDVSGTKEVVTENNTGWIVNNTDDPKPLAAAIVRGLTPNIREEFGPRARLQVESRFGLDPWVGALLSMYRVKG